MRLDTSQHLKMQQQMKLAPRIIQAMEILQLPMMALQERIESEMLSNPVLEFNESSPEEAGPEGSPEGDEDRGERAMVVKDSSDKGEDFSRLDEFTNEYESDLSWSDFSPRRAADTGERDTKMDAMANAPAPGESLDEHLLGQWSFVEAGEAVGAAGRLIITNLDDDGYLRVSLEELSKQSDPPIPMETMLAALKLVQTLEPVGVGARDIIECLLIQLGVEAAAGRDMSLEMQLVSHFLRDIEMNRLPHIARKLNRGVEDIKKAIENISHLNPRPGSLIGRHTAPIVMPDAVVRIGDDGEIIIDMPESNSPRVHIARPYRRMAKDRGTDRQARQFLQNSIRSAQWLISAIEQRRQTVRRVVEEVFAVQRDFLEHGLEALKPLPMMDVAQKVGVHVATVSRAVAGKFVQTPRGIFPLRMFFSGGTRSAEGEDVAWDAVRVKLREIVDAEDKSNPLNDDELADALQKNGLNIARRTVAKYRKLLDIPSARQRKTF
jgi:RNA polymerase sigma-54 factor